MTLTNIRGKGLGGGPNQNAIITVDGWIGPVGANQPEPGLNLRIRAQDIASEPAVMAAFDPGTREALRLFDAPGKGDFPQFRGNVAVNVSRPSGYGQKPSFRVDIHLADAAGALVGFAYPLQHLSGDLHVHDGFVDVAGVTVKKGDASIAVGGRVAWDPDDPRGIAANGGKRPMTELRLEVRGLSIDDELLAALPAEQAEWVRKSGVRGRLDIDGRLWSRAAARAGIFDFAASSRAAAAI